MAADPPQAAEDDTVSITFVASEPLGAPPGVTVNGSAAAFASETKAGNYTYTYTVQAADALGTASVEVTGADVVGNPGSLSSSSVLEIVEAPPVPVYAWPVFLILLVVGTAALAFRRKALCNVDAASSRISGKRLEASSTKSLFLLLLAALLAAPIAMAQAPTVSNVAFVQQDNGSGNTEVAITYDLDSPNGPCDVTVVLSKDGGIDGFPFAVTSVTGDLSGVATGAGHTIIWDIAADYADEDIPSAQIRVTADDGLLPQAPEMLPVAAGPFQMGDVFGEGVSDELPVHPVTLSAYEIGKYEVTNQQIADVYNWADDQGYFAAGTLDATTATLFGQELLNLDEDWPGYQTCQISYSGGVFVVKSRDSYSMADHPVVEISWYGAVAYCNWLSEGAGLTPVYDTNTWTANLANDGYHLPAEAQWEKAAAYDVAAPTQDHWRYGRSSDSISKSDVNYDSADPLGLNAWPLTSPVGWYDGVNAGTADSPSPVGAYDMSGNVWEWCHDYYDSSYYNSSPGTDPEGPAGPLTYRSLRGGNFNHLAGYCRSAMRNHAGHPPYGTCTYIGFRVSRTP